MSQLTTDAAPTNRAFLFIKPHAVTEKTKELAKEALVAKGLNVLSEGELTAAVIDEKKLIDNHYVHTASHLLPPLAPFLTLRSAVRHRLQGHHPQAIRAQHPRGQVRGKVRPQMGRRPRRRAGVQRP